MTEPLSLLSSLFLFQGLQEQELTQALQATSPQYRQYRRGEILCEPSRYVRAVFLLLRGECDVQQGSMVVNSLKAGDSFGVVSLFSQKETFPTTVVARKETEVLMLSREDIEQMMLICPRISRNLITFLTDRIEFLNSRMASLAEPNVERKLYSWLLSACRAAESDQVLMNRSRTAEALHCGRASLYRALEELEKKNMIAIHGNLIHVLNPQGSERNEK